MNRNESSTMFEQPYARHAIVVGGDYYSGKDTACESVASMLPQYLVHVSSGGVLRALPEQTKEFTSTGRLVPNPIYYNAIEEALLKVNNGSEFPRGLFANGWIRDLEQPPEIKDRLVDCGYTKFSFIEFGIESDEILEARRLERWTNPPNGVRRPEDARDIAWERIQAYRKTAAQIVAACEAAGFTPHRIDASGSKDEVRQLLIQVINM